MGVLPGCVQVEYQVIIHGHQLLFDNDDNWIILYLY